MDLGRGLLEISMAILGIALIALLVGNAKESGQLVTSAGSAFNQLLRTVTLQNGMSSFSG